MSKAVLNILLSVHDKQISTENDICAEARALGDSTLGAHEIDSTFFRASLDPKGNIFYQKSDGTLLSPLLSPKSDLKHKRLGWQRIRRSPLPPVNLYVLLTLSHRMVLTLRCPTGATPEFCAMFQNGLATYDGLRGKDKTLEPANAEVPYSSSGIKDSSTSPRTPRKRISKVDPAAKSIELPDRMTDVDIVPPEPTGSDQKTDSGVPLPDKKIYHVLIDRLRVLDRNDAKPWNPPVPEIPEARVYSPMTPQRSARDDTADTAFHAFGSKSSLSPPKRARRAGAGSS
ncbi:hypothetical protein B0H14DRAFT_3869572 [Mycena olivaceomarginata]|nr:hypothetical protein B0H14DRAFT_3869572 [Mycena olivaceomarginata]